MSRLKIPTDRPLCVTPAGNREQRNVDSTSASRQGVATGPIYGLGQITVAQVAAAVLAPWRTLQACPEAARRRRVATLGS